jgi:hypothetical protein
MAENVYYNTSQLFKLGKLKTIEGTPIRSRNQIFHIVDRLATKAVETPWGKSKVLSEAQVEAYNKQRESFVSTNGTHIVA